MAGSTNAQPERAAAGSGTAGWRDVAAKSRPPQAIGLVRERLISVTAVPVLFVVAAAGHGKTTLLGQIAARFDGQVAWYRADSSDRDRATLVAGLVRVISAAAGIEDLPADLPALAEVMAGLGERGAGPRWLLVVDDVHEVWGSLAERELARFIGQAPAGLRIVVAARRVPGIDLDDLKITRDVAVLEADDLRFRSWEVERLYRDIYHQPLPPEDAADLSRRTEGWIAGLVMFHLATTHHSPVQRRQSLAGLGRGSRLVRRYLVREVLGELPPALRHFLRRTSALGVLTAELCDALLDTTDAAEVLEALEQRLLFIHVDRSGERYRYHQVLADHLELELTDELGPRQAPFWYRRAARVLLHAGEVRAAFRAFARAEDWAAAERLLQTSGEQIVTDGGPATDLLPAELSRHDPWLRLAEARRLRGRGRLQAAVEAYREAAEIAEDPDLVDVCRAEARATSLWLPGAVPPPQDPFGMLRAATMRHPWQHLEALGARRDVTSMLAAGVVAGLCGDAERAESLLQTACEHPEATDATVATATCARAGLRWLSRTVPVSESDLEDVVQACELSTPWLARIARALLAACRGELASLSLLRISADADQDRWGAGLVALVQAVADGHRQAYQDACTALAVVDAPVVELWARSLAAAAHPPGEAGVDLVREARSLGVRDVPQIAARWRGGVAESPASAAGHQVVITDEPLLTLRLFGGFAVAVRGEPVDLGGVRPRARAAMHLLALNAGRWVHRDVLADAIWPDAGGEAALRSLQVALSSLRTEIAKISGGSPVVPARRGENYGLVVPGPIHSDVIGFEAALTAAREARGRADAPAERQALQRAGQLYAGDLLPEAGPAEWVLAERDRLRLAAADAACALAVLQGGAGELEGAIEQVRRCLRLDPYRDAAWRLLARLHDRAGDPAAAQAAVLQRRRVMAELGIPLSGRGPVTQ